MLPSISLPYGSLSIYLQVFQLLLGSGGLVISGRGGQQLVNKLSTLAQKKGGCRYARGTSENIVEATPSRASEKACLECSTTRVHTQYVNQNSLTFP